VKLKKVLKATVKKHWHLERMKDEGNAVNYRCEIDTAVVGQKQESADVNGTYSAFNISAGIPSFPSAFAFLTH